MKTKTFRIMRAFHLYTGLFMMPWMLVYAASALLLNHRHLFQKEIKRSVEFKPLYEKAFVPDDHFPSKPEDQAKKILESIDLDGHHVIFGKPTPEEMIIIRISMTGNYNIKWLPKESRLVVSRQTFSLLRAIHYLHFRAGFRLQNWAFDVWAVIVDLVALSIFLWIISGIYIILYKPGKKRWSYICMIAGCLVFAVLVGAFL